MIARLLGVSLAATLASGCYWLNEPDRSLIPPAEFDAGPPDAGRPETGPGDGGRDAGPPDAGFPDAGRPAEICMGGADEDGDGLTDCADPECAASSLCCGSDEELVEDFREEWTGLGNWRRYGLDPSPGAGELTFGDSRIGGVVGRDCFPTVTGRQYRIQLSASAFVEGADELVAFVLTPVDDAAEGERIFDELAITLRPGPSGGLISVDNGDDLLGSAGPFGAETVDVTLEVAPGLRGSTPAMLATVLIDGTVIVDQVAFVDQDKLLLGETGEPGCQRVPGLRMAVEGRGANVSAGRLTTAVRSCVNPSHFVEASAAPMTVAHTVTPDQLPMGPWSELGFSSPTLVSSTSGGIARWDVLVDASDWDLTLAMATHIGFSVGHAYTRVEDWNLVWDGEIEPVIGWNPPTCLPPDPDRGECDHVRSVRDPYVTLPDRTDPSGTVLTFALETSTAKGERDRFGIATVARPVFDFTVGESRLAEPDPFILPGESGVEDCVSLRDPALLQVDRGANEYWLFMACEHADLSSDIRVARLSSIFAVIEPPRVILDPVELGEYARGGVRSPEPVAEYDTTNDRPVIRLWFIAKAGVGGTESIGLAVAEALATVVEETMTYEFPNRAQAYDGNPVLRLEDEVVGGCDDCDLLGFAVSDLVTEAADPGALRTYRFLLARRVNEPETQYQLVPVDQRWRVP